MAGIVVCDKCEAANPGDRPFVKAVARAFATVDGKPMRMHDACQIHLTDAVASAWASKGNAKFEHVTILKV